MSLVLKASRSTTNDLDKYLETYKKEIGWIPEEATAIGQDLVKAIRDRNDPSTWVAFAARTIQTVWEALPDDIRQQAQAALQDLIDAGLNRLSELAAQAASAVAKDVADAIPVIGQWIRVIVEVIAFSVKIQKTITEEKEMVAATDNHRATLQTLQRLEHPNNWIFKRTNVDLYLDFDGEDWRYRPCFARSSGASGRMFLGTSAPADSGSCDKGVKVDCPKGSFFDLDDCHKANSDPSCVRYLDLSALFYPFWSPAYSDVAQIPVQPVKGNNRIAEYNANTLMIERQFALLSIPNVNLRCDAKALVAMRDRFRKFWLDQAKIYAPKGQTYGLLEVTDGIAPGTETSDRLAIDATEEKNYVPTQARQDKFYIDSDGLIRPYPNSGADPNAWGIRATRGPQTPNGAAITVAQFNAVIGGTLAFMSARANFLRSGLLMKALLSDYGEVTFDSGVRAAMRYSAATGSSIPPRATKPPTRATRGGGGGVVLVGGAALVLALLKR